MFSNKVIKRPYCRWVFIRNLFDISGRNLSALRSMQVILHVIPSNFNVKSLDFEWDLLGKRSLTVQLGLLKIHEGCFAILPNVFYVYYATFHTSDFCLDGVKIAQRKLTYRFLPKQTKNIAQFSMYFQETIDFVGSQYFFLLVEHQTYGFNAILFDLNIICFQKLPKITLFAVT